MTNIERGLSRHLKEFDGSPVIEGGPELLRFYREQLRPHARTIQDASLHAVGLWDLLSDLFPTPSVQDSPSSGWRVQSTIEAALDYWDGTLKEDDERRYESFSFESAWEIVGLPFFRPDEWLQNLRLLEPVLIGRSESGLPAHVHVRLTEIYRGFILNQWFGVISSSRATLEYVILDRATSLQINPIRRNVDGKPRYWPLEKLVQLVAVNHPSLLNDMEVIRRAGNRILHPKEYNVISHPKVIRSEALTCLEAIKRTVEYGYSL